MISSSAKTNLKYSSRTNRDLDELFRHYSFKNQDGSWSENFDTDEINIKTEVI